MFKEVTSLDADNTIALGKKDKKTGKQYPREIEGYFLGTRKVDTKLGPSDLHTLQTATGNTAVWGATDLNRKLSNVPVGTMVRLSLTGTRPTPRGDMKTFKVEIDSSNTIEVTGAALVSYTEEEAQDYSPAAEEESFEDNSVDEDAAQESALRAASAKARVEALLKRKTVSK